MRSRNTITLAGLMIALALVMAFSAPLAAQSPTDRSEAELIAVLESDAGVFEKAKACQRLAVVGGAKSVPALAKLLGSRELAHYARFALEPMKDAAVDEVLRGALGELEGDLLVGVVNTIGLRRDEKALEKLEALSKSKDPKITAAAIAAIGRVGTESAAALVKAALGADDAKRRETAAQAGLVCAETLRASGRHDESFALYAAVRRARVPQHVKMAALRGVLLSGRGVNGRRLLARRLKGKGEPGFELALLVSREMPGEAVTRSMAGVLGDVSPERQALIITALGDRGDRAALPAVLKALGGDEEVRLAAARAMRTVGDASAVKPLLEVGTGSSPTSEAAINTLAKLPGDDVDRALLAALDGDSSRRAVVIDLVGRRRIASATPELKRIAADANAGDETRRAALRALGQTVSLDDLPFLIERVVKAPSAEDGNAALAALDTACGVMPDADACAERLAKSLKGVPGGERCRLLSVFNSIGGDTALAIVAATAVATDVEVARCAIRVLGDWRSPEAATVLISLARGAADDAMRSEAITAVSSLIRRLGFPKEQRLARCDEAMAAAKTVAERKTVIHAYAGIPAPETLAILNRYLNDEDIGEAACAASVTIAERLLRSRRSDAARALEAVVEATQNEQLEKKARRLYRQAGGK